MIKKLFAPGNDSFLTNFALLVLRVWLGLTMLLNHGLDKLNNFTVIADKFPDPLHISQKASLGLVTVAETLCAALLVLGLVTRLGALALIMDLGVAFVMVHKLTLAMGPGSGELAFVYLAGFVTLFIAGGGSFSVDKALFGKGSSGGGK
jgi:putative oxidoreductase